MAKKSIFSHYAHNLGSKLNVDLKQSLITKKLKQDRKLGIQIGTVAKTLGCSSHCWSTYARTPSKKLQSQQVIIYMSSDRVQIHLKKAGKTPPNYSLFL